MQASVSSTRLIAKNNDQFYTAVRPMPYYSGRVETSGRRLKYLLDCVMAMATLLMLAPLFLGILLAIKLGSYGPLFYRQRLLGRNGRIFYAYRFRTTYVNSRRLTQVGRMLVRLRLVELPLLINVLKNEMSFVGPRAITPDQIVMYGAHAEQLLSVTPGLTGNWQINGRQQENRIEQDMQYIEHHSLSNDLHILLKTVTAVFHPRK